MTYAKNNKNSLRQFWRNRTRFIWISKDIVPVRNADGVVSYHLSREFATYRKDKHGTFGNRGPTL